VVWAKALVYVKKLQTGPELSGPARKTRRIMGGVKKKVQGLTARVLSDQRAWVSLTKREKE